MAQPQIKYKSGYKYQLHEEYRVKVSVIPTGDITTDYLDLDTKGMLVIKKGYAWDGPSGPSIDTPNFMRGSLVHDALYQLLRIKKLEPKWRKESDNELARICREDGMSRIRAWWVLRSVRLGGGPAASPESRKPVHTAP